MSQVVEKRRERFFSKVVMAGKMGSQKPEAGSQKANEKVT
jgi:hypothetical protein